MHIVCDDVQEQTGFSSIGFTGDKDDVAGHRLNHAMQVEGEPYPDDGNALDWHDRFVKMYGDQTFILIPETLWRRWGLSGKSSKMGSGVKISSTN